ncbi:MAG: UDP-N-acetylglucosamine 2-epimerase (non-hydrolyzing) [Pseudomonadota bacterium]
MKVLTVFGTRPEAIKMAPVVKALASNDDIEQKVCVTAQHREMLDQVLDVFDIQPDIDLNIMRRGQDLFDVTTRVLTLMGDVIREHGPDVVLVHGDTTTAMSAALAAFYCQTPVGHVEAGLRTCDLSRPWPEEMNRTVIDAFAHYLFAPTERARSALLAEGRDEAKISMTGNTVIDALYWVRNKIDRDEGLKCALADRFSFLDDNKRLILVTGHRRESFGQPFEEICLAIRDIAENSNAELVYPVHLNGNVQAPVRDILSNVAGVHLIEPVAYIAMVHLMERCDFIITDSGGVQEEAPAFGKPILVTREVTERQEAIDSGAAKLVGSNRGAIVAYALELLDNPQAYKSMAEAVSPFGDGLASERIASELLSG